MVKLVVQPRAEAAWRSLDGMMRRSKWQRALDDERKERSTQRKGEISITQA